MGLFDRIFKGGKKKKDTRETVQTRGAHMPDLKIPVDEKFTIQFKKNGGKFIYCVSFEEVLEGLRNIIEENHWQQATFLSLNPLLQQRFAGEDLRFTPSASAADVLFTTCEHLVAVDGSILVNSNQLLEKKLHEVPENIIVFATTSQLVESIGEGLKMIKKKYRKEIPTNITTLKHFNPTDENARDFRTYGSSSKHLYLLLLEDL
jgi:L-lactate utilization protein LutC